MAQLKPKLGLWASVSIVVGTVIGSSIFMKPATMAGQLGSPLLLLLVWIVAGVVSMFGGMINAEIGSAFPKTGGQYIYFRFLYGDFLAWLYGWAGFIVINTASIAGIAFIFAQYTGYFIELPNLPSHIEHAFALSIPFIGRFYPLENFGVKSLAIGLILLVTFINAKSLKAAGAVQVLFTILKLGALLVLVGAAFFSGKGDFNYLTKTSVDFDNSYWIVFTSFIAATTGALAAYDGWNNLGFIAGEIKEPKKNIPRGLLLGLGICILVYVLTTEAYFYILPIDQLKQSPLLASEVMTKVMGGMGATFVALLVMISTAGSTNGNIMPCARVIYAMGEEKKFFSWTGKVDKKSNTPVNALWLQAAWGCCLVLLGSFDMLMDMFVFITWIFYGFAAYGIFIFRKKVPKDNSSFRMKGYPILPILFIGFAVLYTVITIYNDINNFMSGKSPVINSIFGLALTAMGLPLYWWFRRKGKSA